MPYDDSKSSDYSLKVGIGQYAQMPKDTDKKRDWEKLRDYTISSSSSICCSSGTVIIATCCSLVAACDDPADQR